jgi:hypothetical protein
MMAVLSSNQSSSGILARWARALRKLWFDVGATTTASVGRPSPDTPRSARYRQQQRPLHFRYLWTGGALSEVWLTEWCDLGGEVEGKRRGSDKVERFRRLRMWEWYDDSYTQLPNYTPRGGRLRAPVHRKPEQRSEGN